MYLLYLPVEFHMYFRIKTETSLLSLTHSLTLYLAVYVCLYIKYASQFLHYTCIPVKYEFSYLFPILRVDISLNTLKKYLKTTSFMMFVDSIWITTNKLRCFDSLSFSFFLSFSLSYKKVNILILFYIITWSFLI